MCSNWSGIALTVVMAREIERILSCCLVVGGLLDHIACGNRDGQSYRWLSWRRTVALAEEFAVARRGTSAGLDELAEGVCERSYRNRGNDRISRSVDNSNRTSAV